MGCDWMSEKPTHEMDVLILAPFGKDSALIAKVLSQSGMQVRVVDKVCELAAAVPDRVGTILAAEEAIVENDIQEFSRKLKAQPQWSDLPIIVLTGGGISTAATEIAVRERASLGNVTLLERPLRAATLASAVRSALAARRRQYEIRDHLEERRLTEEALRSARDFLESLVEERTLALRRLSAQLLRVQDDERRRIARELHDSVGQYLVAIKLNLDLQSAADEKKSAELKDVIDLVERAIGETRTLSHLLHPPLLDTAGFASAALWYVEGFGKRSGIKASLAMPEDLTRLPANVETALFRIMQEALTNVHRHSGSSVVDITLTVNSDDVKLVIKDCGRGMPKEVMDAWTRSGTNVGVGLAGIRERVKELGGTFHISSSPKGTTLDACIPMHERTPGIVNSRPPSQMFSSLAS